MLTSNALIHRRAFLLQSTALISISTVGLRTASAEAATVILFILEAAAAIVTIAEYFDKPKYDEKVRVNLNNVIAKIDEIISDLGALREYIDIKLDEKFRDMFSNLIAGQKSSFENELSGLTPPQVSNPPATVKNNVTELAISQRTYTYALRGYGPPAYLAVATGAISTLAMWVFLRVPRAQFSNFVVEIQTWLKGAIDPTQPRSFADAMGKAKASADNRRALISGFPVDVWLGYYQRSTGGRRGEDGGSVTYVNWYAKREGDYQRGINLNPSSMNGNGPNPLEHMGIRLIPTEGGSELRDDEAGRARARNGSTYLNKLREQGMNFDDVERTCSNHIEAIKQIIAKLGEAAAKY